MYYSDFYASNCRLSSGSPSFCDELAGNVSGTSYTHADPDEDRNYYWVIACNNSGCSDIDSANPAAFVETAPSATVPGLPTGLTAAADGETEIDLSWTAPSDNGGASVTGYRIEVSDNGTSWRELVANTNSTATSYSHAGLTGGDTRYYRVSAINSEGTGQASNIDSATTSQATTGSPDLSVGAPAVSHSLPTPNLIFSLTVTVRNRGDGPSPATTVRYYRATTPTIVDNASAGNTQVGTTDSVSALEASGSIDLTVNLPAPSTTGTYYFGGCVKAVSGESNTQNNCSSAVAVTVQTGNRPPQLTGDVDDKIVELGESFTVDLSSLFTDPDGDDITSYGFTYRTKGILTGTVNTNTGILSLRAIAVGETIVAVDARDSNGRSGASEDLFKVTVVAAETAAKPSAPTGLTATADGQTRIDLSWRVPSDDGGADITGYKIEVSTDGSNWSDLVADTNSTTASYSHTGLTTGSTRHYRVSAINSEGMGPASNTDSATTDAAPTPDLVMDTPTVSDSSPTAGESFTLSARVRNQGDGPSGSTTVRYYRSSDSTITTSDTEVGTDSVSGLSAGDSGDESVTRTTPDTPGTYYYGACVDSVSGESDTTNNCSASVAVTVNAAPAPDLVVDTPTVSDSSPTAGESFTLRATVRNQGDGPSGSTTLRYYRSSDSTISTGDTEVGTDSVSSLSPGGSGDESISLTAPDTPGTYYYGACVGSVSEESDTANNCSASAAVTVGAAPAPDPSPTPKPTGEAVTGTITSCEGEQVAPGINSYRITISGTVTASRAVENVRVEGTFNGSFVGIDVVGDMEAGEIASFSVTGYVSESVGSCGADVEWLEIN